MYLGCSGDQWHDIRREFRLEGCSVIDMEEKEELLVLVHADQDIRLNVICFQGVIRLCNRLGSREVWQSSRA